MRIQKVGIVLAVVSLSCVVGCTRGGAAILAPSPTPPKIGGSWVGSFTWRDSSRPVEEFRLNLEQSSAASFLGTYTSTSSGLTGELRLWSSTDDTVSGNLTYRFL